MFLELPLAVRLVLIIGLGLLTVKAAERGLQNGILLLLIASLPYSEHAIVILGEFGLPNLTLERVVLLLMLPVFVWHWKQGKIYRHPPDWIEYNMALLVVVVVGSTFVHGTHRSDEWGEGKLHFYSVLSGFLLPYLSYFIMRRAIVKQAQAHAFVIGVALVTLYLGITGLGEAWNQSWLVFPKYILDPDVGGHVGWVRGPFVSATWNGVSMVMGLPLLIWLSFGARNAGRWLWLVAILMVAIVLPYVFQRAVWASAAAAVGISMLTWPKRGPILVASVVLVVTAARFMMPHTLEKRLEDRLAQKQSIAYRFRLLDASYTMIGEQMATGVGYYRFDQLAKRRFGNWVSSHNTPLTLFTELGLLGFLPYVTIFGLLFFESAKIYWYQPSSRVLIGGLWGVMAAYMIAAVAVDMRAVFYPNGLLFALWGMVLGMTQRQAVVRHETRASFRDQSPALSG